MFILLKNANDITETYKRIADLELQIADLEDLVTHLRRDEMILKGRVTGLELENESLLREAEHWKTKAQFNKDRITNG